MSNQRRRSDNNKVFMTKKGWVEQKEIVTSDFMEADKEILDKLRA